MCRKTADSTPEYNRQGFQNIIMGKTIHQTNTEIPYKLFMTILGKKIDRHILENNKRMETQACFTTGRMIEDNLFTLQYCIEGCYKLKRQLIVTCLDYSKAFDSIRQRKKIETLIHYKIHNKIIDAIANIYRNDYTEV